MIKLNKPDHEINRTVAEQQRVSELINNTPISVAPEFVNSSEYKQEDLVKKPTKKKKISKPALAKIGVIATSFVTVTSVLILATVTLVDTTLNAAFNEIAFSDGHIKYVIEINGYTSDADLSFVITDPNNTKQEISVFEPLANLDWENDQSLLVCVDTTKNQELTSIEYLTGLDELKEIIANTLENQAIYFSIPEKQVLYQFFNHGEQIKILGSIPVNQDIVLTKLNNNENFASYVIAIDGNIGLVNRTFDRRTVNIYEFVTEFKDVTFNDMNNVDGYLYVTLDYRDDYNEYLFIYIYLEDVMGNIYYQSYSDSYLSYFEDNMHNPQRFFIANAAKGAAILHINIYTENGSESFQYNYTIE